MAAAFDRLLDQYDRGQINRRQLLKGLAVATGGVLAGGAVEADAQGAAPIVPVQTINHLHIEVSDINRSAEFYAGVFGAKKQTATPMSQTMSFPGATSTTGYWVSLSKNTNPARPGYDDHIPGPPGHFSHVGLGVKMTSAADFQAMAAEVKKRFPNVKAPNTPTVNVPRPNVPEMYLFDPDGAPIQLIAIDHNGYLGPDRP
jgi:extradiol dioxygenase family protein